jgi:hypothetical protein
MTTILRHLGAGTLWMVAAAILSTLAMATSGRLAHRTAPPQATPCARRRS